jgi:hypothetical protein
MSKTFGEDKTWKRKESCCGRSFASHRISAKNAWPRARHRSHQLRASRETALLPKHQTPACGTIAKGFAMIRKLPSRRGYLRSRRVGIPITFLGINSPGMAPKTSLTRSVDPFDKTFVLQLGNRTPASKELVGCRIVVGRFRLYHQLQLFPFQLNQYRRVRT